ncbi:MAG: sulfatase-like hydrolase/transferase [Candidatus Saccharicenans sp.]
MSKKKKKKVSKQRGKVSESQLLKNKISAQKESLNSESSFRSSRKITRVIWPAVAILAVLAIAAGSFFFLRAKNSWVNLKGASSFNLLLITLDTTRADHLGCYGYAGARTPNLDRLAAEGLRMNKSYCQAPLTLPSHTSILTGLEPASHGVRNNGHYLSPEVRTITESLKAQGYKTAAFVSSFSVDSRFGLDRGFEVYDDNFQPQLPFKTMNAERRAEETFSRFAKWLENNWQSKFFCWVHYYDPHLPYDPPSPFKEEFRDNPYDGEIAYVDVYVGKILEALKEKGILDKTIVIVAGDHGEGLGGKIERGHGIFLYEETVRVPLIFWNKKIFSHPRVIKEAVRLMDIAPTILELAGLGEETKKMQGKSLLPVFELKEKRDRDCLMETFFPRENFGWSELVALVSGRWKFIQAPRPELYDLQSDPEENKNLFSYSPEKAEEMKNKLQQFLLAENKIAGSGSSKATAEDLERLRSLGYLNFAPARPGSNYPDPKDKIDLLRMIQQAQMYEYEENYAQAEEIYSKILEEIPDSPSSYVSLAIAQARQKKLEAAIETLKRGLVRIPDSEILMVRLGHTYLISGRINESFETMTKVLEINPKNVDALTVCAGILDSRGQKEEARQYYQRALTIEPESKFLRMSYAGNLASSGQLAEAVEIYKKLIDDFPEEQAFYQYAGIAYSYLGDYSQAIFYLRQAVAIKPTAAGYFNLAVAYEKSGDPKNAIKYFRIYLENSEGDNPRSIAQARAELNKLEKETGETN